MRHYHSKIYYQFQEFDKHKWLDSLGTIDLAPEPCYLASSNEYWWNKGIYSPTAVEWRTLRNFKNFPCAVKVWIEWFPDYGWLTVLPFRSEWVSDVPFPVYADGPIYYRIGCEHKFVEMSKFECSKENIYHCGNCYHVEKCDKCGFINSYDSSG